MLQIAELGRPGRIVGKHDDGAGAGSAPGDVVSQFGGQFGSNASGQCIELTRTDAQAIEGGTLADQLVERFHRHDPGSEAE